MSINHYATNFYKKISSKIDTNNVTGDKLLNITQCNHINLFIIKKIHDDWLNNFNKNKIPFFDYDNKETKEAQKNFMNILSKHIKIKPSIIPDIIIEAIIETVKLAANPSNYIVNDTIKNLNEINGENLKARKKYYPYHKNVFNELINDIQHFENNTIGKTNLIKLVAKQNLNECEILIKELNSILEIDRSLFINLNINYSHNEELFNMNKKEYDKLLLDVKLCDTFQEATEIILDNLKDNYKHKLDDPKLIKILASIKENY
jgi:hypothetical protein|tara:strand:+ start:738 stop:1523 length:786 start_codon:yes stop_codon:yes gene_type:complete